jgi:hypothetical protein
MSFTHKNEVYKHYHISYLVYSSGKTEVTVASPNKVWQYGQKIYEPIYNFSMKSEDSAKRHAHSLVDAHLKQFDSKYVDKFLK